MVLRPYQRAAQDAVFGWFGRIAHGDAERTGALELPTGAGKTFVAAQVVRLVLERRPEARILFLCHRRELVEQTIATFERVGLGTGVLCGGLDRREHGAQVLVATVQTAFRDPAAVGLRNLVLLDECHMVAPDDETMFAKLRAGLRELNPDMIEIGLSGTPWRTSGGLVHGPGRQFAELIHRVGVAELIEAGWLAPLRSKSTDTRLSVDGVARRAGEFVRGQLEAAVGAQDVVSAACREMVALGADRRSWLVFCVTRDHARAVRDELRGLGVEAEVLLGDTPADERSELVERFRARALRVLVGVDVLSVGFDAPCVDLVAMLRPTCSAGLYAQQLGRGLRLADGKTDCVLLDYAGNVARHGPLDALDVPVGPTRGGKHGVPPPTKVCPECREIVHASVRRCPACGHEWPARLAHGATASDAAVLGGGRAVHRVRDVRVGVHEKEDKPPSLRVSYRTDAGWFSEWICLQHEGFAGQHARRWWRARFGGFAVPRSVGALSLGRVAERVLERTEAIRLDLGGEFTRILGHVLREPAGVTS